MGAFDRELIALDSSPLDMAALRGKVVLVVNVASRCGLTPQYAALEELQRRFAARGFTVLGTPCNQFAGQEPGDAGEIATFCATSYGISFPLTEKLAVNGRGRHPLYDALTAVPDGDGVAGDVDWNFEKFLVSRAGEVRARFRSRVLPDDARVLAAIEDALDGDEAPARRDWRTVAAGEVQLGERVRPRPELELTVTRIEPRFAGRDGLIAFVEDSAEQWVKVPTPHDAEVAVLRPV